MAAAGLENVTARDITRYLRPLFPQVTLKVRAGDPGQFLVTLPAMAAVHWGLGTPAGVSAASAWLTRRLARHPAPATARITGITPKRARGGGVRMTVITITITPAA